MTQPFDLLGPLPAAGSTTVLEASAGTGKTFTLAALATRYLAEGRARPDQLLLVTFGRLASRELRDRVRAQVAGAAAALSGQRPPDNDVERHLCDGSADVLRQRAARLRDALADFDAATIVTIHQFCALVLKSLGVAGDTDETLTLVESLADLVGEIVDDRYLQRFGHDETPPRSAGRRRSSWPTGWWRSPPRSCVRSTRSRAPRPRSGWSSPARCWPSWRTGNAARASSATPIC